jgi:hypothetical protein
VGPTAIGAPAIATPAIASLPELGGELEERERTSSEDGRAIGAEDARPVREPTSAEDAHVILGARGARRQRSAAVVVVLIAARAMATLRIARLAGAAFARNSLSTGFSAGVLHGKRFARNALCGQLFEA